MKRATALFLSLAMVASMFAGIAFASTPTAALQVSVAGTVARDSAIVITGALLPLVLVGMAVFAGVFWLAGFRSDS